MGVYQCRHPEGTQMLGKVRGWQCQWPVAIWSMRLCLRKDLEQVLESHKPGDSHLPWQLLRMLVMMLNEDTCQALSARIWNRSWSHTSQVVHISYGSHHEGTSQAIFAPCKPHQATGAA